MGRGKESSRLRGGWTSPVASSGRPTPAPDWQGRQVRSPAQTQNLELGRRRVPVATPPPPTFPHLPAVRAALALPTPPPARPPPISTLSGARGTGTLVCSQLEQRPEAAPRPRLAGRMRQPAAGEDVGRGAWGAGRGSWSKRSHCPSASAPPPSGARARWPGRGSARGRAAAARRGARRSVPDKRLRGGPTPRLAGGRLGGFLPSCPRRRQGGGARPAASPWRLFLGHLARPTAAAPPRPWHSCLAPAS